MSFDAAAQTNRGVGRLIGPRPRREWSTSRGRITRADVMTAAEVATLLALPKSTVYELARRGELPCARLCRTIRFLREDVEARLRGSRPGFTRCRAPHS